MSDPRPTVTLTLSDKGRVIVSNTDNIPATALMLCIHRDKLTAAELVVLDALLDEIMEWM